MEIEQKQQQTGELMDKDLLDRITLRIASCQEDDDLETAVEKFLPMVLNKLSSSHESVRTKVMELLIHLNKRLKSRPQIKLPVMQLLLLYQDPTASAFLTNFTIIYIKMGFPRMSLEEQIKIAPLIINSLDGKVSNHQDSLLSMMMAIMPYVTIPSKPDECVNILGLNDNKLSGQLFLDHTYHFLLLPYTSAECSTVPPGMSPKSLKRVYSSEYPLTPENLEKIKVALIKILACGCYNSTDIVPHLVVASSDSRHSVATTGDMELKKIQASVNWDSQELLNKLYDLFLGTVMPKDPSKCTVKPDQRITPANTRIRLKIIPFLIKSVEATRMIIPAIQTIFECLNGKDTKPNLRCKALMFILHLVEHCPDNVFPAIAVVLYNEMKKISLSESTDMDLKTEMVTKNLSLSVIPKIIRREPKILKQDLVIVNSLLKLLANKSGNSFLGNDYKIVIKSVISEFVPILKTIITTDTTAKVFIESLILSFFKEDSNEIKEVFVNFAGDIFDAKHIPSKIIIFYALGDSNPDLKKSAIDKLASIRKHSQTQKIWPSFTEIMTYRGSKQQTIKQVPVTGEMVSYIHACLHNEVISAYDNVTYFEGLKSRFEDTFSLRTKNVENWESLIGYLSWLESLAFSSSFRSKLVSSTDIASFLLEAYCALSVNAFKMLVARETLDKLTKYLESDLPDSSDILCQLASLIINKHSFQTTEQIDYINQIIEKISNTKLGGEIRGWWLLIATYSIVDSTYIEDFSAQINQILNESILFLKEKSALKLAACKAISEIARSLPMPNSIDLEKLIEDLSDILNAQEKNNNINEAAALTLASMAVGNKQLARDLHQKILDHLLIKGSSTIGITFHFVLGDALATTILKKCLDIYIRLTTKCLQSSLIKTELTNNDNQKSDCERVLNLILEKYADHTKKSIRNASSVWLLCVFRHCGHLLSTSQKLLIDTQKALLKQIAFTIKKDDVTISEHDITQDITPKTLSLVYNSAEDAIKPFIEKDLQTAIAFYEESASSSARAIKELCYSAEKCCGNLKYIYTFLDVISFCEWGTSSKTSEFYRSDFVALFRTDIELYYPKLIPNVYINIHHPNNWVRTYFASLWDSMVVSGQRLVILNKYLKEILEEIEGTIQDSDPGTREASCSATSNLMQIGSHSFKNYANVISKLLEHSFRTCDDMKETVRIRAEAMLKSLLKVGLELCDRTNYGVQTCEKSIGEILPMLVNTGLSYLTENVRHLCLNAVIKISELSGSSIKTHLPVLIPSFLEAMTMLESQTINYLSVRLESDKDMHEKLDAARLQAVQSSPVLQALKQCIQYIDAEIMVELAPKLVEVVRSSVSFTTKVSVCIFVSQLIDQCPNESKPYANKLMSALTKSMRHRNRIIQKCSADTLGHVVRLSSDKNIESFLKGFEQEYFGDVKADRRLIASIMKTVTKHSADVATKHSSVFLPLAFFAMHEPNLDSNEEIIETKAIFEELWTEFTPGTETGIKLYSKEILALIYRSFESQSWHDKHQAALSLQTFLKEIANSLDKELCLELFTTIKANLFGRIWKGKECILTCFKILVTSCKNIFIDLDSEHEFSKSKIFDIIINECRKENFAYKTMALEVTSEVMTTLEENNKFNDFYKSYLLQVLSFKSNSDGDDDEDDDVYSNKELTQLKIIALKAMKTCWPSNVDYQDASLLENIFEVLTKVYIENEYKIRQNVLLTSTSIIKTLDGGGLSLQTNALKNVHKMLYEALLSNKLTELQSLSVECIDVLITKLGSNGLSNLAINLKEEVTRIYKMTNNGMLKEKAKTVLDKWDDL